jgi:hypothetical protein
MDNEQRNILDALQRVQQFNAVPANALLLATITEYAEEETNLATNITGATNASDKQGADTSMNVPDKDAAWLSMAKTIIQYQSRGNVKATQVGNIGLALQLSRPLSFILHASDAQTAITRATNLIKVMNDNILILTNILPANITTMTGKVTTFSGLKDTPVMAIETKKAQGTDQIDVFLTPGKVNMENMIKLVGSYFPESALLNELVLQAHIRSTGERHNYIAVTAVDELGNPIPSGELTSLSNLKTSPFADGLSTIESIRNGMRSFKIVAPDFITQEFTTKIIRSTTNRVTIIMVAGESIDTPLPIIIKKTRTKKNKDSATVPVTKTSTEKAPATEKPIESIKTETKTPDKIVPVPEVASPKPAKTKHTPPEE